MTQLTNEAKRLKEFRKTIAYSQTMLAEELKVSQDAVSRYESGKYSIPIDVVKHLHLKHKLNYVWFFHGTGTVRVTELQRPTITTDVKQMLLENNILKSKIKVLEEQFDRLSNTVDKLLKPSN